jgi:predicted enzyme involved in methoxymalonyl-ACP biosynthesis
LADADIMQFVMSCRVFGLGIEEAVYRLIAIDIIDSGASSVSAVLVETPYNSPCRDLYGRCGFTLVDKRWVARRDEVMEIPTHIVWTSALIWPVSSNV